MNEPLSDQDLQALYGRQRQLYQEHAPIFAVLRNRAQAQGLALPSPAVALWRRVVPATAAVMLLAFAVFISRHQPPSAKKLSPAAISQEMARIDAALQKDLAAQHSLTAWASPTDFLLQPITPKTP
jgi:hypothetical protein